jgi:hypothetical protein
LLLKIFTLSLDTGVFPDPWKTSIIAPHHKYGPRDCVSSYRPIHHTPISSRILEKVVKAELEKFAYTRGLIHAAQHGFLSKRSCMTCQLDFLDHVTSAIDSGLSVVIVLLDMHKAFDSVPHNLLLSKLHSVGLRDPLLKWFNSYLTGRHQVVQLDHYLSSPISIPSGVIQGSVLGPLLFLIYINDICGSLLYGRPFIFADDIKLVYSFPSTSAVEEIKNIQLDLNALEQWSASSLIHFSSIKSNILCHKCALAHDSLKLNSTSIPTSLIVTDLGIRYSRSFNFSEQVLHQLAKAKQAIGYIKRSIQLPEARLELYKLRVRPLLEYCSIIYSNLRKCDRIALENLQRSFTKSLIGCSTTLCYRERCQALRIEPLWLRRLKLNLTFLHNLVHQRSFTSLVRIRFLPTDSRNLRNKVSTLPLPFARTNLRSHFFLVKYSALWNKLPEEIRETKSLPLFRKRINLLLTSSEIMLLFGHCNEDTLYEVGPQHI